jgi:hypothetical protein
VSASATVVTIGAARVHGDGALAGPLTGLSEAVGMPVRSWSGKAYLFGMLPTGDAFLAWSAAARPVGPLDHSGGDGFPAVVRPWWRWPWHALSLLALAAVWSPLWVPALVRRHRRPPGAAA